MEDVAKEGVREWWELQSTIGIQKTEFREVSLIFIMAATVKELSL